jgi:hypothetical protein
MGQEFFNDLKAKGDVLAQREVEKQRSPLV